MTTTQLPRSTRTRSAARRSTDAEGKTRISFRQPVSTDGYIDAVWWPRSLDLTAELPPLLDDLWTAGREITRFTYGLRAWDPAPRSLQCHGQKVRLGGFATSDPLTARLSDAWGRERIDVLVLAPDTDPAVAQRAMHFTDASDGYEHAAEILARATDPTDPS